MQRIRIIDSHTGGEPTRLVVEGGPDLGAGSVADRLRVFRAHFDDFRRAVVNEPRGSDVIVGALLCPPSDPACTAGVIFFNNVGTLGMCGHGTIGLVASLSYLGRIAPGVLRIETPVGVVEARLHAEVPDAGGQRAEGRYPNRVSVRNIPSYRHLKSVTVDVDGIGPVTGDVAWGGNWFFLVHEHGQAIERESIPALTAYAARLKSALTRAGVTGADGAEVDHIELFGPSSGADSRSFVLCPGNAYDRSPCGTGTSAKLACLYEDGKLRPGQVWQQESVIGSMFQGSIEVNGDRVIPTIIGDAWVCGEGELILDPRDPFRLGI
jgi:4-hydroxyproline epimerase